MKSTKPAPADWPIHELIAGRWSPRAIGDRPVEREKVAAVLEAARWAPSCYNEQPWRYYIATQNDRESFERLGDCLLEGNAWARRAWLLGLSVARLTFRRNGKPNRHAWHDVGAASENLFLQATHLGLSMHQMAGFDVETVRALLGPDDDLVPVAMFALGYPGNPDDLPEKLRDRESAPRTREPLEAFVFEGAWGKPTTLP